MSLLSKTLNEAQEKRDKEERWFFFKAIKWLFQEIWEAKKTFMINKKLEIRLKAEVDVFLDLHEQITDKEDLKKLKEQFIQNIKTIFEITY